MVATFSSDWPTMSDAFQNGDCKKLGFIKIFDECIQHYSGKLVRVQASNLNPNSIEHIYIYTLICNLIQIYIYTDLCIYT